MFTLLDDLSAHFQKSKNQKLVSIGFWLIVVWWYIKKDLDLGLCPPYYANFYQKPLTTTMSISCPSFMNKWFAIQKIYSKMYSSWSANTHHDKTIFEVHGIGENVQNLKPQEQNMT